MFQVDPLPTQGTLRSWNVSETRSKLAQQPMACQKATRQPSTATTKKPHHGSHVPKNDRHGSSESIHHRSRRPPGQRDRNKVFSSPPSNKPRKVRRVPNASSIFKGASLNCNLLTRPNLHDLSKDSTTSRLTAQYSGQTIEPSYIGSILRISST